jgi:hypothetical protein
MTIRVTTRFSADEAERLAQRADRSNATLSDVVRRAVDRYLDDQATTDAYALRTSDELEKLRRHVEAIELRTEKRLEALADLIARQQTEAMDTYAQASALYRQDLQAAVQALQAAMQQTRVAAAPSPTSGVIAPKTSAATAPKVFQPAPGPAKP